jgi:DNA helicase-2/ATP-dependent DNA helicase PcrA
VLCGITRAQELLYLSHARERRLYGSREPAVSSQFLKELPAELMTSRHPTGELAIIAAHSSAYRAQIAKRRAEVQVYLSASKIGK